MPQQAIFMNVAAIHLRDYNKQFILDIDYVVIDFSLAKLKYDTNKK